jgi:hypothetical protein
MEKTPQPGNTGADVEKELQKFEGERIFKGRLGFKGSRASDVIEGYTLTYDALVKLKKQASVRKIEKLRDKIEALIRAGAIKLPIIYVQQEFGDSLDWAYAGFPPATAIVVGSGISSHGIAIAQEAESRGDDFARFCSGIIVIGSVNNVDEIKTGQQAEIDTSNQEVIIKLSGQKARE